MVEKDSVIPQNITDTLELNYMPYAMSVIISRAIPDIDGFKPSHRKLLYTMYKMGLLTGNRIKSADVVGQTMRLNPHGDASIYETMVRLTKGNEALLLPLIDSKGNFGKQYSKDMAYAASRYTEVKLATICKELFNDIDKNTVDFVDNYSGTMKEPLLLPTTFPCILANPNQGIAVGMASSICSFNLKELCTATINYIKNNETNFLKHLIAPDFSTGGYIIYNKKKLEEIYKTGRGSIKLRAKYSLDKTKNIIEITEIPYTTSIELIIDKIISLVKNGKIKEINDIRDETDKNGLKIAIDIKKDTNIDILMHKLYTMSPLSDTFHCNFNILINGQPRVLGIEEILKEWTCFRVNCIRRKIAFDIEKKSEKEHLLIGLSKILLDIDKAIEIIRNTPAEKEVIKNIMQGFDVDELQAEYIVEIKLRNLNKEYILRHTGELNSLKEEIRQLKETLSDDNKIKKIIIEQLKEISKKYGKPRMTEIIYEEEFPEITRDDLIEDFPIKLIITEHNYLKKTTKTAQEQKIKEDDFIMQELETTNKSDILLFTNKQNIYKTKAYELPESKASNLGEYLPNILNMEDSEKIIYMASTSDYLGYMLFAFANGKIAKIEMQSFATKTNRKKLINAYCDKDTLIFIAHIISDIDLIAVRNNDKASLFSTSLLSSKISKTSPGVQVYSLKKNSTITKIFFKNDFKSDNYEYYRTNKIPTTGHFITEKDLCNIKK